MFHVAVPRQVPDAGGLHGIHLQPGHGVHGLPGHHQVGGDDHTQHRQQRQVQLRQVLTNQRPVF